MVHLAHEGIFRDETGPMGRSYLGSYRLKGSTRLRIAEDSMVAFENVCSVLGDAPSSYMDESVSIFAARTGLDDGKGA